MATAMFFGKAVPSLGEIVVTADGRRFNLGEAKEGHPLTILDHKIRVFIYKVRRFGEFRKAGMTVKEIFRK